MMTSQSQWAKLVSQASNPRCLLPGLLVLVFVYILIYLLWATPISHGGRKTYLKSVASRTGSGFDASQFMNGGTTQIDKIVPDGEGVWIEGRHIEIMSAIFDLNPVKHQRVMLPAFLKHSTSRDFVCCFHRGQDSTEYHQVPAVLEHIDLRFIVDYQSATFYCPLPENSQKNPVLSPSPEYPLMTFALDSCEANKTRPMRINYPVRREFEFAVCTKVAYSRLEPSHLVEWFEYLQEVGVSKVVTFHNNLHRDSKRVFDYYSSMGLLEFIEYHPRGKEVIFTEANGQYRQARHDKTLIVSDCQYRLGGYDFVMTIDFDELPVPQRPYGSINWVLQDLLNNHTDASAFRLTPILLPPSWRSEEMDLYHWTLHKGSYIGQYCLKWVYIPSHTKQATTHEHLPREQYKSYVIPQDVLHFLHFRECKRSWQELQCATLKPSILNETSLARFNGRIKNRLKQLPLQHLVQNVDYVHLANQEPPKDSAKRRQL